LDLIARAPAVLRPFGVGSGEAHLTALLYLAEVATRYLVDREWEASAPPHNPGSWATQAIISELGL
jgi:hypothetical protein